MRWDNLLTDRTTEERASLPLFANEAVVRHIDTPQFRGITFYEVEARSILNHVPGDRFGFNWTLNLYRGCTHACRYCFARPTHGYLDFNAGRDFETKIVVKVNAVELLRRELRRPSWPGALIAMGTNTDPYQRAEGHYRLMRGVLSVLNAARNPYSILTKGTLIRRDIDLLEEGAAVAGATANFSVGTVDERVWRETEPGTPHPRKRLEVVRQLNRAGIPCGVLMAPILPGISDAPDQLEATVAAIAEAGATHITPITLHLRPGVREEFLPWLARTYPDLLVPYGELYRRSEAPSQVRERIAGEVAALRRKVGASESGPTGGRGRGRQEKRSAKPQGTSRPQGRPASREPDPTEQLALDLETPARRRPPARLAIRRSGGARR